MTSPEAPREWWVNFDHSCQMGEMDVVYSEAEAKEWPGYTFTHVIEKSAYDAVAKERDHLRAENARMREALEYQLTALRKICEGSMFTPESERAAAEKIIKAALAGDQTKSESRLGFFDEQY